MNKFDKIFDIPITDADLMASNMNKLDAGIYAGFGTKCRTNAFSCHDCCSLCISKFGYANKCIFCGHEIPSDTDLAGGRSPYECANCGVILLSCFYEHTSSGSLFVFTGYLNRLYYIKDDII